MATSAGELGLGLMAAMSPGRVVVRGITLVWSGTFIPRRGILTSFCFSQRGNLVTYMTNRSKRVRLATIEALSKARLSPSLVCNHKPKTSQNRAEIPSDITVNSRLPKRKKVRKFLVGSVMSWTIEGRFMGGLMSDG